MNVGLNRLVDNCGAPLWVFSLAWFTIISLVSLITRLTTVRP
jgi:hypothetical protein